MQKIEELKEIFSAARDMGLSWQKELVELRQKNLQLEKENHQLKNENAELKKSFDALNDEIKIIRNEIVRELAVKDREDFQEFVKNYLTQIRKCVEGTVQPPPETDNAEKNCDDTANKTDESEEKAELPAPSASVYDL